MHSRSIFLSISVFVFTLFLSQNCLARDYSEWLKRCEEYRNTVESILETEQVSRDFYYLMVAESKCTEKAVSNKGARGFWQLMSSTSRHYGCSNPDDLECATKAAAKYLKRLSNEFVNFNDVIAAYNMGGHNYARNGRSIEASGLIERVNAIIKQDSDRVENKTGENKDG